MVRCHCRSVSLCLVSHRFVVHHFVLVVQCHCRSCSLFVLVLYGIFLCFHRSCLVLVFHRSIIAFCSILVSLVSLCLVFFVFCNRLVALVAVLVYVFQTERRFFVFEVDLDQERQFFLAFILARVVHIDFSSRVFSLLRLDGKPQRSVGQRVFTLVRAPVVVEVYQSGPDRVSARLRKDVAVHLELILYRPVQEEVVFIFEVDSNRGARSAVLVVYYYACGFHRQIAE